MDERIQAALDLARQYGMIDGQDHKQWVIDQMIRALLDGEAYAQWVAETNGPEYVPWDEGIAP